MDGGVRAVAPSVNGWNAAYLEAEHERFLRDPTSVSPDLRAFFQGFQLGREQGVAPAIDAGSDFQARVHSLIRAYREVGHIASHLDPFGRAPIRPPALGLAHHGLGESDLDRSVSIGFPGLDKARTLRQLVERLESLYCGSIGAEFMHVSNAAERQWLIEKFESARRTLSRGDKAHILEQIVRADVFEKFLQKRYPGDKRFSLEGSESLIPTLDHLIETATDLEVEEIVLGMAHRGRLNVLNNILGKTYEQIFTEFEESWEEDFVQGGGDVKYHRGYSGDRRFRNGKQLRLVMNSNPSHLESVDAVVLGRCRAKQRLKGDEQRRQVIPVLIHGDAAVIAQGMVMETLNLSQLEGYTAGGCVHFVINNLIGFTTTPEDARSSRYCTDVAKMIECPIVHVNGEDPEACVQMANLAIQYRQMFRKDIWIDVYCYRRYGHNEQDEASFTQPLLYSLIRQTPPILRTYADKLLAESVITESDVTAINDRIHQALEQAQAAAKKTPYDPTIDPGSFRWDGFGRNTFSFAPANTAVSMEAIREVCDALGRVPDGFKLHPKLQGLLDARRSLPQTRQISYADAESLAYGTLLLEGVPVRLSGQDCRRGTFSHRHAVLRDQETALRTFP